MTANSSTAVTNLWTPYGLRGDPYFLQPLDPTTDPTEARPASLLVGREMEMAQIKTLITNSDSSRTVIQGDAGVGKTSFVSALKTQIQTATVLTHADPIRVKPEMTATGFITEVLKVILQMRATERLHAGPLANVRQRMVAGLRDPEGDFWTRLGRIIIGEDNTSIGLNAGPVGLQGQRGRIAAEASDVSLFDELKAALGYMAKDGTRHLVLHVNNMEGLSPTGATAAAALIHSLRDAFLFDYAHWLFVGTTDIEQRLFRVYPQVSQIINRPVTLGALSPAEVAQLLTRRYEHLQMVDVPANPPVAPTVAAQLYARFGGELRGFLALLGAAVRVWAPLHPGQPLAMHEVIASVGPMAQQDLVAKIGENDAARLEEIMAGKSFDTEFRVEDVKHNCSMTQAGASKLVQRLVGAGVVTFVRSAGRNRFYALAGGPVSIALGI